MDSPRPIHRPGSARSRRDAGGSEPERARKELTVSQARVPRGALTIVARSSFTGEVTSMSGHRIPTLLRTLPGALRGRGLKTLTAAMRSLTRRPLAQLVWFVPLLALLLAPTAGQAAPISPPA